MNYGERISHLREQKRLTQKQMAHLVGITRAALSHYENNRREPDLATLLRLVDFFGVSLDYLTGLGKPVGIKEDQRSSGREMPSVAGVIGCHIVQLKLAVHPGRLS